MLESTTKHFMDCALEEAKKALKLKEVPVGSVAVRHGKLVSSSHNLTNIDSDPLAHAELNVIKDIVRKKEPLDSLTFYITIEPCAMCHGILKSIGANVYFGYHNEIFGAKKILNEDSGICLGDERCIEILREFYNGTNEIAPVEKRIVKSKIKKND